MLIKAKTALNVFLKLSLQKTPQLSCLEHSCAILCLLPVYTVKDFENFKRIRAISFIS